MPVAQLTMATGTLYSMEREETFEWDPDKAASNCIKHGISFEDAKDAFLDIYAIDWPDKRFDYEEDRSNLIGVVKGRLLFVSYTMRKDAIRIISARGAVPHEHRKYYRSNRQMGKI
jgi:uncharacterized protein